jgi:abhydrolase domain-containing protein 17
MTTRPILPFDQYANVEKIPRVACPVLILHGTDDDVIGFWHGEALYAAAKGRKTFYRGNQAGHYAVPVVGGEDFWRTLKNFTATL